MDSFQNALLQNEQDVTAQLDALTKLRTVLRQAGKDLATAKRPLQTLRKLAADLQSLPANFPPLSVTELAAAVNQQLGELTATREHSFVAELRNVTSGSGITVGHSGDELTIGPFIAKLHTAREMITLEYAKVEVARDLPMDAETILARVAELTNSLIQPPSSSALSALANEFEEAIRVVLARQKVSSFAGDLRAELPAVYRELSWMRGAAGKVKSSEAYPLVRFVVEVKTLVTSPFNLDRPRRLRLETAVIENTRNAKKSVFIPNNLHQGFGEGTFFQAIVLLKGG